MSDGSCLCGAVQYRFSGEVETLYFCHCQSCQKATSSAFNTAIVTDDESFGITAGEELLKRYASSPGVYRHFCANCGSHIFSSRDAQKGVYRLRAGTLNKAIHPQQKIHIFAAEKASWDTICDGGQIYAERPTS